MKLLSKVILLNLLLLATASAYTQKTAVADVLGMPKSIVFAGNSYQLSWSSHPSAGFYKEEFSLKGETGATFTKMLLFDAVTTVSDLDQVVDGKLAELAELQKSNPLVYFKEVPAPAGERMIDFTMMATDADGKTLSVAERNVYRYSLFTGKSGRKCIALCGIAERAYGAAITGFLAKLKSNREPLVAQMRSFKIPVFTKLH